jgi:hypothetical protein
MHSELHLFNVSHDDLYRGTLRSLCQQRSRVQVGCGLVLCRSGALSVGLVLVAGMSLELHGMLLLRLLLLGLLLLLRLVQGAKRVLLLGTGHGG